MKRNYPKFKKGDLVLSNRQAVLVTGPGKNCGYESFAGVVVLSYSQDGESPFWPVGTISDSWSTTAFKKAKFKMNDAMKKIFDIK